MTVTLSQVVGQARTLMNAGLSTDVAKLAKSYQQGAPTITLTTDKRIQEGSNICLGLTTLVSLTTTTGRELPIVHAADGSPDTAAPLDTPVMLRPRHTSWQVFTEIVATVEEISSAAHGLYQVKSEQFSADTVDETYPLAQSAQRILRVRYLRPGSMDEWINMPWRYQPGTPTAPIVRAGGAPGGTTVQIQYACAFDAPTDLGQDLLSLGMPDSYARLLAVGAARNLSLSSESRRAQPFSQGDPRRAEEVPMTANVVVYDRLNRRFRDMVAEERARLVQQHPYRHQMEAFA